MNQVVFYFLSAVILVFSLLTVTSSRILRAAVYLLFVLIATAGIYFLLGYNFLAGVQLTLYAGGIIVLIIFAIMLTGSAGEKLERPSLNKFLLAILISLIGTVTSLILFFAYHSFPVIGNEIPATVKMVGASLINPGDNGYVLPFELISVLLLAAIVGAIVIAKKATR